MARPVTLFTGQWADLPLEDLCKKAKEFGYDGLELACWGDHFEVDEALSDDSYCQKKRDLLDKHDLKLFAISNHIVGQGVLDNIDQRHKSILPEYVWGDGDPAGVNERYIEEMKNTARAAQRLGVGVVNGFTRSSIWHLVHDFPPTARGMLETDLAGFAERWKPIFDVFDECGVKFALHLHPFEFGACKESADFLLDVLGHGGLFGFNVDVFGMAAQGIDPVQFIRSFPDSICQVHMQDPSIASGEWPELLNHQDDRLLEFMSSRRMLISKTQDALSDIGYDGPISVGIAEANIHSGTRFDYKYDVPKGYSSFTAQLVTRGDGSRLMERKTAISVSDLSGSWDSTINRMISVDVGSHLVLPTCYLNRLGVSNPEIVSCCYFHDCGSCERFEAFKGRIRLQLHMEDGTDLVVEPEALFTDVGCPPALGIGCLQEWFHCDFQQDGLGLVRKPEADVMVVTY